MRHPNATERGQAGHHAFSLSRRIHHAHQVFSCLLVRNDRFFCGILLACVVKLSYGAFLGVHHTDRGSILVRRQHVSGDVFRTRC